MVSLGLTWSHLVSLGLTGSHLVSLGLTWSHLISLGLTWSHLVSHGLTWSHLVSLGEPLKTPAMCWGFKRARDQTPAGVQTHQNHTKNTPEHSQDTPEHTRTTPGSTRTHENTPMDTQKHLTLETVLQSQTPKQRARRARPRGPLLTVANPSDGNIIVSRAHTASHRTHETKRFPGCLTPQPPIYHVGCSSGV